MGLIGDFISSAVSVVSSVGSAICSGISSVCSAIGGAFFSGAGGIAALASAIIAPVVGLPNIGLILAGIAVVVGIVSAIAEKLGIKTEEETPEELGMKAEEAEKKPEDFDSIEAYIEYLRNEIQIDKQKLEKLSDEDRVKYTAIGTAIYIKGIEEKYGIQAPAEFWNTAAEMKLSGDEVKGYMDTFREKGITNMKDMSDYIRGEAPESGTKPVVVSDAIMDTLKKTYPELSEEALEEKFCELTLPEK